MVFFHLFIGKCKHPKSILGKFHILFQNIFPVLFCQFPDSLRGTDLGGPVKQYIHRTLGQYGRNTMEMVFGTHQLSVGIKRNLFQTAHHVSYEIMA